MKPGQVKQKSEIWEIRSEKTKSEFRKLAKKSTASTLLTLVGPRVGNVDSSFGVLATEGEVWLGRLEGSMEESLGQSAALGNFSEPDQSWTHFGNVPVAATSSAHDGLVLSTLDQKASVGMHVAPKVGDLGVVHLVVVVEDGPACERRKELVFLGLRAAITQRDVASSCGPRGLLRHMGALCELTGVQAGQVIRPGDDLTVLALPGIGIVAPEQQAGGGWLRGAELHLAAEGVSNLQSIGIEPIRGYYHAARGHLTGTHTSVQERLIDSLGSVGGARASAGVAVV